MDEASLTCCHERDFIFLATPLRLISNNLVFRIGESAAAEHLGEPILSNSSIGVAGELERLAALRDQGALTDDEFAMQKARVLGTPSAKPTSSFAAAPPSGAVSDGYVYALLTVPFVAAASAVADFKNEWLGPVPVYVLSNFAFVYLDYWRLRAAGHPKMHSRLLGIGAMIVPIYLLARATDLGRGRKYAGLYLVVALFLAAVVWAIFHPARHGTA